MNRVGIYVRLSDEDVLKKEDESESIKNQKLLLTDYAINQGWLITEIYVDEDYSGADTNRSRPSFGRMIRDAQDRKFDIILCKSQSRFTRSMEELEKYVHKLLPELGIRFVTVIDRADSFDKSNKKSRQINGLVNEWYIEDLSNDIKNTFKRKMQDGQFIGSWAPYGYKKSPTDRHKLIIDEYAADIVRMIFRLYLSGNGVSNIVKILNDKGIDRPMIYMIKNGETIPNISKNNFWAEQNVYRILKNDVYIGTLTQGKMTTKSYKNSKLVRKDKKDWVIVKNNHEAIIDPKDFYTVQEAMKAKRRTVKYTENEEEKGKSHMFATKTKCAECGGPMVKTVINNGYKRYPYLRCKNHLEYSKAICPKPNRINYDKLILIVEDELRQILNQYKDNKDIVDKISNKINNNNYAKLIEINKKNLYNTDEDIKNKENALANLYIDKVNGDIDARRYELLTKKIDEQLINLNMKKINIETELSRLEDIKNQKTDIDSIINEFNLNNGLSYQIVQETIEYISIGLPKDDGSRDINIQWKI